MTLEAEIVQEMLARGLKPHAWLSNHLPGADSFNKTAKADTERLVATRAPRTASRADAWRQVQRVIYLERRYAMAFARKALADSFCNACHDSISEAT